RTGLFYQRSGRWGPYRQASPPPARHRPGARSARRGRWFSLDRRPDVLSGEENMFFASWFRRQRSQNSGKRPLAPRKASSRPLGGGRGEDRVPPDGSVPRLVTPVQHFVSQLSQDLLQHPPDPARLAVLTGLLEHGASRRQVALNIESTLEYRRKEVNDL